MKVVDPRSPSYSMSSEFLKEAPFILKAAIKLVHFGLKIRWNF